MNPVSALQCGQCTLPFGNLPPSAFVNVEPRYDLPPPPAAYSGQPYAHPGPLSGYQSHIDVELGRKTFFWYRVYCGVMLGLYFLVSMAGIFLMVAQPPTTEYKPEEMMIMGIIYGLLGAVFFIIYLVALVLPPKPYNWIVGIVMIAIGMTTCCFWPAVIPLLIFWIKPETKTFLGRK